MQKQYFVYTTKQYDEEARKYGETKIADRVRNFIKQNSDISTLFSYAGDYLCFYKNNYRHLLAYKDFNFQQKNIRIYVFIHVMKTDSINFKRIIQSELHKSIDDPTLPKDYISKERLEAEQLDWKYYYKEIANSLETIESIGFTVDSGLINRLGIELVGKAETAVSELIKNAYDADATEVTVEFINTDDKGGTLIITDNGLGMTEDQLINGFMRISSTEKIHNPKSLLFKRTRAGKKGIGRFATQRLGEHLSITTQAKDSNQVTTIDIDWNLYKSDTDLESIKFPLSRNIVDVQKSGTCLEISGLREKWTTSSIEKIFSYVNSLFQPNYLSERSKTNNIAVKNEASFKFSFIKDGVEIKNKIDNFYEEALVAIEGYIGDNHEGVVSIDSLQLKWDVHLLERVEYDNKNTGTTISSFPLLKNVRFKAYYFIYEKDKYKAVSENEIKLLNKLSSTISGIRLYRNGFRVLPFGEPTDDWIHINQRWGNSSGTNIPFSTKHLFGFVEIIDDENNGKSMFQETSSREGLIENEAFEQLINFVGTALDIARKKLQSIIKSKKNRNKTDITISSEQKNKTDKEAIVSYKNDIVSAIESNVIYNKDEKQQKKAEVEVRVNKIKELIKENDMLRVLASLGLSIGNFAHEVRTLQNYIYNNIYSIEAIHFDNNTKGYLDNLKSDFDELFKFTNYFEVGESQLRDQVKIPINLNTVVRQFVKIVPQSIDVKVEQLNYDVITKPMHPSEWSSILSNLYSNSRKAIKRNNCKGKILIQIGVEKDNTFLLFNDNGDGIKDENKDYIFDAFFTTSRPVSYDSPSSEHLIGTGLGLKIIKDIILDNKGTISLVDPTPGYTTCFKITIPQKQ